jgi:hypothetical protein
MHGPRCRLHDPDPFPSREPDDGDSCPDSEDDEDNADRAVMAPRRRRGTQGESASGEGRARRKARSPETAACPARPFSGAKRHTTDQARDAFHVLLPFDA